MFKMLNNKSSDDAKKLLQKLSKESANPDGKFKQQLKTRVLEKYSEPLLFSFFPMRRLKFAVVAFSVFIILLSLSATSYLLLSRRKDKNSTYTEILSGAERDKLFAEIIKNNPQKSLGTNKSTNTTQSSDEQNLPPDIYSKLSEYSYFHSLMTTTPGPAINQCKAMQTYVNGTSESFEYHDSENNYSKSMEKTINGTLTNYLLYINDTSIFYQGGKYAVRFSYDDLSTGEDGGVTDSVTVEDTPIEDIDIANYIQTLFGDNSEIEEVIKNGEVQYYIVTYEYNTSCDIDLSQVNSPETDVTGDEVKIITKDWYLPTSVQIFKEEQYLNEEKPENLLAETEYSIEGENVSFDSVAGNFNFDYDVEIKEFDYSNMYFNPSSNEEDKLKFLQELETYLKEGNYKVIFPNNSEYELQYFDSPVIYYKITSGADFYYLDRDFYAEGEYGDQLYKNIMDSETQILGTLPSISASFINSQESGFSISTYKNSQSNEKILNDNTAGCNIAETKEVDLEVDGEKVKGTYYKFTLDELKVNVIDESTQGTSGGGGNTESVRLTAVLILFEFSGKKYSIGFGPSENEIEDISDQLDLKSYDSNDPEDLQFVLDIVEEKIEQNASVDAISK